MKYLNSEIPYSYLQDTILFLLDKQPVVTIRSRS